MKIDHIVIDSVVTHWMYFSILSSLRWFAVDFFAGGLHTRTVARLCWRGTSTSQVFRRLYTCVVPRTQSQVGDRSFSVAHRYGTTYRQRSGGEALRSNIIDDYLGVFVRLLNKCAGYKPISTYSLTHCCRALTLALARLSCNIFRTVTF